MNGGQRVRTRSAVAFLVETTAADRAGWKCDGYREKRKGASFDAPFISTEVSAGATYQTKNEPMLMVSDSTSLLSSAPLAEKSFSDLLYSAISFSHELTSW